MRCWGRPSLGSPVALALACEARDLRNTSGIAKINADDGNRRSRLGCCRFGFEASGQRNRHKAEHKDAKGMRSHKCSPARPGVIVVMAELPAVSDGEGIAAGTRLPEARPSWVKNLS